MSNIKLNCCICGKELGLGDRVSSNGILWRCEDCTRKQKEENDNKDKTIADLEAKLAESEKNYKDARELGIEQFHSLKEIINSSQEEIDKLKQQLAEKEKESKDNLHHAEFWQSSYKRCIDRENQDKISFAVEQLTQAKEYIKKSLEYMWNNNAEMTCRDRGTIDGIYTKLDEQIEELTHQHEDKGE